jgi:hypothetical protein
MDTLNRAKQLQDRTKKFAVRIIKAFAKLPKDEATRVIGQQFLRSGTALAANYRAACRERSTADFIDSELITAKKIESLWAGCEELLKISSASLATAKQIVK